MLCSPLPCVEEKSVQLSQKSVLGVGKAKYVTQDTLHSICESHPCFENALSCVCDLITYLQTKRVLNMLCVSLLQEALQLCRLKVERYSM